MNEVHTPTDVEAFEFVLVWKVQHADDRGQMADRGLIPDICDFNDGEEIADVGYPPAHPNCLCETAIAIKRKDTEPPQ